MLLLLPCKLFLLLPPLPIESCPMLCSSRSCRVERPGSRPRPPRLCKAPLRYRFVRSRLFCVESDLSFESERIGPSEGGFVLLVAWLLFLRLGSEPVGEAESSFEDRDNLSPEDDDVSEAERDKDDARVRVLPRPVLGLPVVAARSRENLCEAASRSRSPRDFSCSAPAVCFARDVVGAAECGRSRARAAGASRCALRAVDGSAVLACRSKYPPGLQLRWWTSSRAREANLRLQILHASRVCSR
ncbi:hypothetical protein DFJ73DRAFT_843064 [Zopfochytrium polystomum]|nr:hypothetical protein DFJ73DRAFT_843064 [Zopfochytrium polystomum]